MKPLKKRSPLGSPRSLGWARGLMAEECVPSGHFSFLSLSVERRWVGKYRIIWGFLFFPIPKYFKNTVYSVGFESSVIYKCGISVQEN